MKTVLVTGAGRGIGMETARAFLADGWRVLALDRDFSSFALEAAQGALRRIDYDLTDVAGIAALVASLGEVHTLVNNAGTLWCEPYDAIPEAHKREILAVNLEAPVALMQAVAPQMRARHRPDQVSGRIVNVGSVAAFTGHPDLWYGATKAALLNATKSFAGWLGREGVLVNAVAPGPTLTPMYEQLPESRKEGVMRAVYSGRACSPQEVAAAIHWLGSASPPYMSGVTLDVNNGSYPR